MYKLSKCKKIQIVLLIMILISTIVFIISFVKVKQTKKIKEPIISETVASPIEKVQQEENETENEFVEEDEDEIVNPEDTSWDEEAKDTKIENSEKDSKEKYYIKVNYGANVVTIYQKDPSGKYTVPVKAMVCSTGKATPTSGTYKMSDKYRWHQLNGGVYGQYCSRITGHILFHSVPYKTNSPDTLKYVAYDKLGTKASAGCIRLTVADAYWIYANCSSGTYVEFYSSADPGPLGKPTAKKISSNEACRNWDPTDPLPNNPWKNYTEPAVAPAEQPKEEVKEEENNSSNENTTPQEPTEPEKNTTSSEEKTNTLKENNTNTTENTNNTNTTENTNTTNTTENTNNTNTPENINNNTNEKNVIGENEDVTSKGLIK